jgi:subtilisin family serine protease
MRSPFLWVFFMTQVILLPILGTPGTFQSEQGNTQGLLAARVTQVTYLNRAEDTTPVVVKPIVAVIDSGAFYTASEFSGSVWASSTCVVGERVLRDCAVGYDFIDLDTDPFATDDIVHGTAVASVIQSHTYTPIQFMFIRAASVQGVDQQAFAQGIRFALDNGATVINTSLVFSSITESTRFVLEEALERGVPVVAAAGNEGLSLDDYPQYPASLSGKTLFTIGALEGGQRAEYSNYGNAVHVYRNGAYLATTGEFEQSEVSGTSFAAAAFSAELLNMLASSTASSTGAI